MRFGFQRITLLVVDERISLVHPMVGLLQLTSKMEEKIWGDCCVLSCAVVMLNVGWVNFGFWIEIV